MRAGSDPSLRPVRCARVMVDPTSMKRDPDVRYLSSALVVVRGYRSRVYILAFASTAAHIVPSSSGASLPCMYIFAPRTTLGSDALCNACNALFFTRACLLRTSGAAHRHVTAAVERLGERGCCLPARVRGARRCRNLHFAVRQGPVARPVGPLDAAVGALDSPP